MASSGVLDALDSPNSTWSNQVVGATPPSSPPPVTIASVFRPFGTLPGKALPRDENEAIIGFASATAALCIALAIFLTVRIIRNRVTLSDKNVRQVPIFVMMAMSCLFMVMCLVSVADASSQYPSPQSLWGQAFSGFGYIGLVTCGLTPLFYKPLGSHSDKATHIKEIIVMVINVITVVVLSTLEVVVIALNQTAPRGLLIGIFAVKIAILVIYTLVGTFLLTDAKFQQLKQFDKDAPSLNTNLIGSRAPTEKLEISGGIAVGRRMAAFAPGLLFTFVYTLTDSFESPILIMRGIGIMCIFGLMITTLLISWSIFITILDKKMATGNTKFDRRESIALDADGNSTYAIAQLETQGETTVSPPSSGSYGMVYKRG